ncbi:MAG: tetratricopeptide repeat protein [Gemmataceae bacterium]|nr:tetratricopeptide repeat protein [Gemmataceae bacterium]
MTRHSTWTILAGMLASLGQAGCAQTSALVSPLTPGNGEGAPGAVVKELPADKGAQVCLRTAESLEKGGKHAEAIQLYEKARQKDARLHHVCRRLAVLYDRVGNFPRAQEEYDRALKLQPDDPSLLNDLGYSHYCQGNWDEAEKCLRRALEKNPKSARAWTNLGLVLGQKGLYAECVEAFARVVSPARAQCNLGFILTTQGKRDEARAAYREALRLDPELKLAEGALAKLEKAPVVAVSPERPQTDKRAAEPRPVVHSDAIIVDPQAGGTVGTIPAEDRPETQVPFAGTEEPQAASPGGLEGTPVSGEWREVDRETE